MTVKSLYASLLALGLTGAASRAEELRVLTGFPGGSAKVEKQAGRTLHLTPAPYPDKGWSAWWYFKLEGVEAGETVTLDVGKGIWATPDRAMFSHDNKTWQHTSPGKREKDRIVFQQKVEKLPVWFAWGPPFVLSDAEKLVREVSARAPYAKPFVLTKSRDGFEVPALRIADGSAKPEDRLGIWVHARQHAWESGSSWVGKGFLEWLVSDDPQARELRQKAEIFFVPIMDVDNVQRGAGGKNQIPQDHNRDWSDAPYHPEVAAAQKQILAMNRGNRFDMFVDLHNPAPGDKKPFYFTTVASSLNPTGAKNLQDFFTISKEEINGPLPLENKLRESGPGYDKAWEKISKNWVTKYCAGHVVAVTLETSWNTPASTQAGYEKVGQQFGRAMARYFSTPRR